MRLLWDKGNREHTARHGVSAREIEELFDRNPYIEPFLPEDEGGDEEQFRAYGTTAKGRYITVPFTIRKDRIRAITAWPMTSQEFKHYADKIH